MKKIYLLVTLASAVVLSSCINDLDREPLNETDFTSEVAYDTPESYMQGLGKIYGGFCLVGQAEPGASEISVSDAGASELTRAWWSLQELTTDASKVAWVNDPWTRDMNTNTWSTVKNDALAAIYERAILTVSLVNEYLRQTDDGKLAERGVDAALKTKIQRYRAEARFLRAYCYWMMMDAFGNPPFVTEESPMGAFMPPQIQRADLFGWIEGELQNLIADANFPNIGAASYPQVDKGAAWGLLARMYLNAKVYTGAERWTDAKNAASQVIGGGYALATNYAHLFMDDNGENPNAMKEMIFAVEYDRDRIQSWGGTTFLINGSLADGTEGAATNGSKGWGGQRTTYEYAQKFGVTNPNYVTGAYTCADKRAMFYIKDRAQAMLDMGVFKQGWSCVKYSRYSSTSMVAPPGDFASTDFPMMRLAEMYLIYAEATLRAAGGNTSGDATSVGYLNALRSRAGLGTIGTFDLQYILDERARELMWESHRRTDLIRYDLYTGDAYVWPWKGGVAQGRSIDVRYNLCPLLQEDVNMNDNLVQNPGYTE